MIKKVTTALLIALCFSMACASPPSKPEQKQFRFFVNADPQMGAADTKNKGLRTLNNLLSDFVSEVNAEHEKNPVDFVVYNGDLVWKVKPETFDNFSNIVAAQKPPVALVHGNHDGGMYDENFSRIQSKLSGYKKLNYAFSYGDWRMVVIGAQEKYVHKKDKEKQLAWLRTELKNNSDKNVMLFMHYHVMPVGLSQMEFYSYWPDSFKHQLLDAITEHGNVKYVFSGHVHSGIKGSMKSSLEFKGTKFVVCPTPVMARPFGEEVKEYVSKPRDKYFRRGYYLEVVVDGDDVKLKGHKIKHPHITEYPDNFKKFTRADDLRFFLSEPKLFPKENTRLGFSENNTDWFKSYRYHKDGETAFSNVFTDNHNELMLTAPWGSWTFDEYMETYVPVKFDQQEDNIVHYKITTPFFDKRGAGGYIRVFLYGEKRSENKQILLYWGHQVKMQKFTYQSWFYHANANRINPMYINQKIKQKKLYLKEITFDRSLQEQDIKINVNAILNHLEGIDGSAKDSPRQYSHMVIGHGVWVNLNRKGAPIKSQLTVKHVDIKPINIKAGVLINGSALKTDVFDQSNPFHQY